MIPRARMKMVPKHWRTAHAYCFFLHDQFARLSVEYEQAEAHVVSVTLSGKAKRKKFEELVDQVGALSALRAIGMNNEARRVQLNTITVAMVSDCAHHIYEALRCLEKRKVIPAFSLLRKPFLDSMLYLSWMLADEDDFYREFTAGDAIRITRKVISNRRSEILAGALAATNIATILTPNILESMIFDSKDEEGLYGLFQHALHLVTVERVELKTEPENFNFIFRNPLDDDVYELLYSQLPTILLFLSHLIVELFERITPIDSGAKKAFVFRSIAAYHALLEGNNASVVTKEMTGLLSGHVHCVHCGASLKITKRNLISILLDESYRCNKCRKVVPIPLSWMF